MKTKTIWLVSLMTIAIFASCSKDNLEIAPEGPISTKEYSFTDYDQINVSHQFEVYVTFSETTEEILVEAQTEIHPYIVVEKKGNSLRIKFDRNLNIQSNAIPKVFITSKNIQGYHASGEVILTLENTLRTDKVDINLSGKIQFMAHLVTARTEMNLSGEVKAILSGSSDRLIVGSSGDAKIMDYDLQINHLECNLSGSSEVQVSIDKTLDIIAAGKTTIRYKGAAIISSQRLSGEAQVINIP